VRDIHSPKRGDLYVKIEVQIPVTISKKQKELLKEFAESSGEKLDEVDKKLVEKRKNFFH
jgi:molecular chaperone DnaJ